MIIALEGLDNSGKTIIANSLKDVLSKKQNVVVSKELTTSVGQLIKERIQGEGLSPIDKAFLFAADRQIRFEELLRANAFNGVVIFDRYVHSALAYRSAEGVDVEWVRVVNKVFPKSDYSFYIDISPEESIRRNTDTKFNIRYNVDYLSKVRNAYLQFVQAGELYRIDGMRDIDSIQTDIVSFLQCKGV